jgi:hypothetical protein
MVSFMPQSLYPREESPLYPLDTRLSDPRAGLDSVKKRKISFPCRDSNPSSSSVQPVVGLYFDSLILAIDMMKSIMRLISNYFSNAITN